MHCKDEIKLWIQHLLIATKNSIERVKTSIENYMYARTDFPQLFDDQLIKASMYKDFYNAVTVITFPHLTPDHRMVFYWSFNSSDPSTFDPIYLIQRFRVVLDYHIKHATEFFGFHSILDLANFKLGHLSQVDLLQVRKIMNYADVSYAEKRLKYTSPKTRLRPGLIRYQVDLTGGPNQVYLPQVDLLQVREIMNYADVSYAVEKRRQST
ncbi:uncharacterized protein LOC103519620 [Diaphorina citri]|uniref:Uncharacterized protein LOC103519620 n=1 Tax=Diaphorina citri TaxID=121845 RepID=A0A3Q0JEE4_DIACI|nr:uncharacterized protein LOC103519620 [Diaphorina citri]